MSAVESRGGAGRGELGSEEGGERRVLETVGRRLEGACGGDIAAGDALLQLLHLSHWGCVWGGERGSGGREKEVSLGDGEGSVGSVAQSGSFLWEAAKAIRRVVTRAGLQ